jgi:predicted DNA-binding transcriptional regulator YafY
LDLLQALRRRRRAVSAHTLADELGVSLRTLYRDIATLRAEGAEIRGEPGIGYVLRPSFFLPPMMLSQAETEALMLGMRWVSTFGDRTLAIAAASALAKIEEVLPKAVRDGAGAVPLRVGAASSKQLAAEDLAPLRDAIRAERKLAFVYRDKQERKSRRVIWPFAIGYFPEGRILVGWCETRKDYRHFRSDRLSDVQLLDERYPRPRTQMFREWQQRQHAATRSTLDP